MQGHTLWVNNNYSRNYHDIEERPVLDENRNKMITYDKIFLPKPTPPIDSGLAYVRDRGYEIIREIGRGGYGAVYKARSIEDVSKIFAIKINFDIVARSTIYLQVAFFHLMRKKSNLPQLYDFFFIGNTPHIVLQYFQHNHFIEIFDQIKTLTEVKHYMLELLKGICVLKQMGIYHRDIKPHNFLYNMQKKKGIIIDFGLAEVDQVYIKQVVQKRYNSFKSKIPQKERQSNKTFIYLKQQNQLYRRILQANKDHGVLKVGTESYVCLETLLHVQDQGHQCQMWSTGVVLLQLLTQKLHFFNQPRIDRTEPGQIKYVCIFIMELAHIFGTQALEQHVKKYQCKLKFPKGMPPKGNLRKFISLKSRIEKQNDQVYDLLTKLIQLDSDKRIKVEDAIFHPFFDQVRQQHFKSPQDLRWLKKQKQKRFPKEPKQKNTQKSQKKEQKQNKSDSQQDPVFLKSMSVNQAQSSFSKSMTKPKKDENISESSSQQNGQIQKKTKKYQNVNKNQSNNQNSQQNQKQSKNGYSQQRKSKSSQDQNQNQNQNQDQDQEQDNQNSSKQQKKSESKSKNKRITIQQLHYRKQQKQEVFGKLEKRIQINQERVQVKERRVDAGQKRININHDQGEGEEDGDIMKKISKYLDSTKKATNRIDINEKPQRQRPKQQKVKRPPMNQKNQQIKPPEKKQPKKQSKSSRSSSKKQLKVDKIIRQQKQKQKQKAKPQVDAQLLKIFKQQQQRLQRELQIKNNENNKQVQNNQQPVRVRKPQLVFKTKKQKDKDIHIDIDIDIDLNKNKGKGKASSQQEYSYYDEQD